MLQYSPTAIRAGQLLQRKQMSQAQQNELLSKALQEQKDNDRRTSQAQMMRERSMEGFGPGAGLAGVAAQLMNAYGARKMDDRTDAEYQQRQQRQNEMYAGLLGSDQDPNSPLAGMSPQQRQLISKALQSGDSNLIEAVAGQVLKTSFEPAGKPKFGMTTANGQRIAYREDDPTQTISMGTADDKPPSEWDMYERAMQQVPEAERVPFLQYKKMLAEAGSTRVNTNVTNMMPGPKKADEAFAGGPYVDWLSGGYANVQKNIQSLDEAIGELRGAKEGDLTGAVGYIPDGIRTMVAPQSVDVQQRVEQVVQGGMREVLGGQYTQAEADAYIKRMYNPKLIKDANIRRIEAFRKMLMRGAQAKQAASMYFQKNGTLEGYQGQMPTWDDFYDAIGEKRDAAGGKEDPLGIRRK